jgi:uncharacterized membrane protein
MDTPATAALRSPARAAFLLGFALGGFFDGILLHQVLQWHHLLSGVAAVQDLRAQVLADGLFHALMYLVACIGLVMLWRSRPALQERGAGKAIAGAMLLGFGVWHVLDAVLSHWLTGIHRIRPDAANPLAWDLGWLAAFGLLPLAVGWWIARRPRGGAGGRTAAATLGLSALLAGPVAALGPGSGDQVMVLFGPGTSGAAAFEALVDIDARVLWVDRSGGLWAVKLAEPGAARQLYRSGAWLVTDAPLALGCISWSSAAMR